jgi:hypothetical protein
MAIRGGRRPRFLVGNAVATASGRWGRRRARVSECYGVVRAEEAYTDLLRAGAPLAPGWSTDMDVRLGGETFSVSFCVLPNAGWRCGRLFMVCAGCDRRCTRLYWPVASFLYLACRRCFGLTFASRTKRNYKSRRVDRFGFTYRDVANLEAIGERDRRARASRARQEARRPYLVARRDPTGAG